MTYHHLYFRRENLTLKYTSNTISGILQDSFEEEIFRVVKTSIEVY